MFAKTAEPIEMPFGLWTRVGPRNHVLDGAQIPRAKMQLLVGKVMPGHARLHHAMSCAKMARFAFWVVDFDEPKEAQVQW